VVALATREGARVLGLEDRVGTLTPGKQADLIVMDLNQAHLTPLYDPYSHLVYAARSADVRHVMVAGRWLLRTGVSSPWIGGTSLPGPGSMPGNWPPLGAIPVFEPQP
jgi:cytosine/adenosine deaminase-related metal-dependent hydrolase